MMTVEPLGEEAQAEADLSMVAMAMVWEKDPIQALSSMQQLKAQGGRKSWEEAAVAQTMEDGKGEHGRWDADSEACRLLEHIEMLSFGQFLQ
jgi:hypothetical protein